MYLEPMDFWKFAQVEVKSDFNMGWKMKRFVLENEKCFVYLGPMGFVRLTEIEPKSDFNIC